jgi:hypothetical protein
MCRSGYRPPDKSSQLPDDQAMWFITRSVMPGFDPGIHVFLRG